MFGQRMKKQQQSAVGGMRWTRGLLVNPTLSEGFSVSEAKTKAGKGFNLIQAPTKPKKGKNTNFI
jgi:hypothetical protein